jgi:hypothetical protein
VHLSIHKMEDIRNLSYLGKPDVKFTVHDNTPERPFPGTGEASSAVFKSFGNTHSSQQAFISKVNDWFGDKTVEDYLENYVPDPELVKIWQAEIDAQNLTYKREVMVEGRDEVADVAAIPVQSKIAVVTEAILSDAAGFNVVVESSCIESQSMRIRQSDGVLNEIGYAGGKSDQLMQAKLASNWVNQSFHPVMKVKLERIRRAAFKELKAMENIVLTLFLSHLPKYLGEETEEQKYRTLYFAVLIATRDNIPFQRQCLRATILRNHDPGWWIALTYHNRGNATEWSIGPYDQGSMIIIGGTASATTDSCSSTMAVHQQGVYPEDTHWKDVALQESQLRSLMLKESLLHWSNYYYASPVIDFTGEVKIALLNREWSALPPQSHKVATGNGVIAVDYVHDMIGILFREVPTKIHFPWPKELGQKEIRLVIPNWFPKPKWKRYKKCTRPLTPNAVNSYRAGVAFVIY